MACPFEVGTFPATSDVAITLGAQPLDAEESINYSLGTVLRFGGFEATIDAYRIDIDDRIVLSENLNTPQVAALIAPFGATVARFFINGVETKTEGIDVVAQVRAGAPKASARFDFVAAGNWNDTEVEKVPTTNVISTTSATGSRARCTPPVLFARINTLSFEEGTPGQQDQPGDRLGTARGWRRLGRESQGHALRRSRGTRRADRGRNQCRNSRTRAICTSSRIGSSISSSRPNYWTTSSARARRRQPVRPVSGSRAERAGAAESAGRNVNLNATNALGYSRYSPYGFGGRFLYARLSYRW